MGAETTRPYGEPNPPPPPGPLAWSPLLAVALIAALSACDDNDDLFYGPSNNTANNDAPNNDAPNNDVNNDPNNDTPNNDGPDPFRPFECGGDPVELADAAAGGTLTGAAIGGDLAALALELEPGMVPAGVAVTAACLDADLVPEGFIPLSAPVSITGAGGVRPARIKATIPIRAGRMPEGAHPDHIRVFVRLPNGQVKTPALVNLLEDLEAGVVRFDTHLFGDYQVAIAADAGQPRTREVAFRSIVGVSMGAGGAAMVGFNNPDKFDMVGALGGASDWVYLMRYVQGGGMGGFCVGADPEDPDTWSCDTYFPDQDFEHSQRFDEFYFSTGQGTGGTFDRDAYINIFQDLTFAFGNAGYYNPDNPMTPPGVGFEETLRPPGQLCPSGGVVVAEGYYDDEYNPDGSLPVIAFCDGTAVQDRTLPFDRACDVDNDGVADEPNRGLYAGAEVQRRPVHIALAVDYNRNGMRDFGEPVIRNFWEPFEDTGTDGVPSDQEEGFDPLLNPDPAGDDYHYLYNPFGTEGDWMHQDGEPYQDFGLDGVPDTPQVGEGGYDYGQGNGRHDLNPNLAALFARNPRNVLAAMSPEDRQRALDGTRLFADGGIRDLFNFAVSTNQLAGALQGHGQDVRFYDDFTRMLDVPTYNDINILNVDYTNLGQHVMVRYGDPDAPEIEICRGDGKHVGQVNQILYRLLLMLGWVINQTPVDDTVELPSSPPRPSGTYYFDSEVLGARWKYSIAFPPGYEMTQCNDGVDNDGDGFTDGVDPDCTSGDHTNEGGPEPIPRCSDGVNNDRRDGVDMNDPQCTSPDDDTESDFFNDVRFPVIYVLHGYGQSPEDLSPSLLALSGFMARGQWPKAILVFPDGACNDNPDNQCNDGVDNDGDGLIDGGDDGCQSSNSETGQNLAYCNDGVDNDRDGLVDDDDHGCTDPSDNKEGDCVKGNFYADHAVYPDGTTPGPAYGQAILELIEHVDANYRTLPPTTVTTDR